MEANEKSPWEEHDEDVKTINKLKTKKQRRKELKLKREDRKIKKDKQEKLKEQTATEDVNVCYVDLNDDDSERSGKRDVTTPALASHGTGVTAAPHTREAVIDVLGQYSRL